MEHKGLNPKTFFFIMEDTDSKLINVGEILENKEFDYFDKMRSKVEKMVLILAVMQDLY